MRLYVEAQMYALCMCVYTEHASARSPDTGELLQRLPDKVEG